MARVTLQIFDLVSKRLSIARSIGNIKLEKGLDIEDRSVEARLRGLVLDECERLGIDRRFGSHLLSLLIKESVRMQTQDLPRRIDTFQRAKYLESQGMKVIHLELEGPNLLTPQSIEDLCNALKSFHSSYTEAGGLYELREAIAHYINESFKVDISARNVIVTLNRRYTIFLATYSHVTIGDEIILFQPSYLAYQPWSEVMGVRVIKIPTYLKDGWSPNLDHLNEAINDSTSMILIHNPNNPTGKVIDSNTLKAIVDLAHDNDLPILSDESYSHYTFTDFQSILQFSNCKSMVVKSFPIDLMGLELCYVISDQKTIERMITLQDSILAYMPEFIQRIALKMIDLKPYTMKDLEIILRRRDAAVKALLRLPFDFRRPDGGIFIFAKARINDFDGERFTNDLLEKKGVAVMPGVAFGNYRDHIRISLCQPENIILEGIERMGELIS
ncbi:MAG: aminotransferase class I/II-fold pyridoxal phosphate-dependent enzyme [Nitrososphaerota archaeon]|nr:aminotransferase class I/II-fold pyridoxal phosphate-dependent enzyme [Nitrososphaerales archaeon]MDW8044163.1 aminotransferase class I/II-fold pyridoxal phosphate-dependent enzyme [Nitrososphaerota archaeon]